MMLICKIRSRRQNSIRKEWKQSMLWQCQLQQNRKRRSLIQMKIRNLWRHLDRVKSSTNKNKLKNLNLFHLRLMILHNNHNKNLNNQSRFSNSPHNYNNQRLMMDWWHLKTIWLKKSINLFNKYKLKQEPFLKLKKNSLKYNNNQIINCKETEKRFRHKEISF